MFYAIWLILQSIPIEYYFVNPIDILHHSLQVTFAL